MLKNPLASRRLARGLKLERDVDEQRALAVAARFPHPEVIVSTDQKGSRILARTFFNQLRESGYTSNQIIGVASELLELVTENLKEGKAATIALQSTPEPRAELRPEA